MCRIDELVNSIISDIRDLKALKSAIHDTKPEIVIHMAAQPLVRDSYEMPVETYETNVMGTVNLLEAVREIGGVKAVVNVTTDKCYENREWIWGYRENEALGGYDPYSSSKACSELVTSAYRRSFFNPGSLPGAWHCCGFGSCRKCHRGWRLGQGSPHPGLHEEGAFFSGGWNFGPNEADTRTVGWVVSRLAETWGSQADFLINKGEHPHEATFLRLDCSKARTLLGWHPKWNVEKAIDLTVQWAKAYKRGENLREVSFRQIEDYAAS